MTLFNGGQCVPEESLRKSGTSPWTLVPSVKSAVQFCWKCESCKDSLQHIWERSEALPCVLRNPSTAEHLQRWCSLFGSKNISSTTAWQALLWKMTHIDLYRTERKSIINSQMCKSSRWIDLLFQHMNINYFFARSNMPDSLDLVNDIKLAFLECYFMQCWEHLIFVLLQCENLQKFPLSRQKRKEPLDEAIMSQLTQRMCFGCSERKLTYYLHYILCSTH